MTRLIIILCFIPIVTFGQTGGTNSFAFLDLPDNARSAALGRKFITAYDDDVNTGIQNPASLNSEMDNSIGFNQALLGGGINHGMVAYAKDIKKVGTAALHLRYVSYGQMDRTDVNGENIGTFSAGDFALGGSIGRTLNENISIGATFNLIWSQLESYSSMGVSVDLAGMYRSLNKRTTITAVLRNAGVQLTTYTDKTRAPLPVQAMLGISHKLEHAPFRFSLVAHHLNKWDLTYTDPNAVPTTDPLTGEIVPVEIAGFGEKLGRHFIVQVETLIGKAVRIRAAFDYNQRKEMLVQNRPGMGGFSFGAGVNFKRFTVDYGLFVFSSAGFNNMISLRTDFDKWRK